MNLVENTQPRFSIFFFFFLYHVLMWRFVFPPFKNAEMFLFPLSDRHNKASFATDKIAKMILF